MRVHMFHQQFEETELSDADCAMEARFLKLEWQDTIIFQVMNNLAVTIAKMCE